MQFLGGIIEHNFLKKSQSPPRPAELGYGGRENGMAPYIFHTLIEHSVLTG
jgi:hypothetical protein